MVLARTWEAALSVTGVAGMPQLEQAGNVLRPTTKLKLSMRIPPTMNSAKAAQELKSILEADPPYEAHVQFDVDMPGDGWNAPPLAPWLEAAIDSASQTYFDRPAVHMGEGGSIPFMGMLGAQYPDAQFLIVGLAPGLQGAHRTGRPFTGDYAGDLLYETLAKCKRFSNRWRPNMWSWRRPRSGGFTPINNTRLSLSMTIC